MAATGRITRGIEPGRLVTRTIDFVRNALAVWRDDPERPHETAEDALNAQLCKFLNARARSTFPMVAFNHQERQKTRRTIDMSVTPLKAVLRDTSIYEPILVVEGKRLPAPATDREREYLTGFERRSGGIQRFKLALHGGALGRAMMVGYLQGGSASEWERRLNDWIEELGASPPTAHDVWDASDRLREFEEHPGGTASCRSDHARPSGVRIRLDHAWVEMCVPAPASGRGHCLRSGPGSRSSGSISPRRRRQ